MKVFFRAFKVPINEDLDDAHPECGNDGTVITEVEASIFEIWLQLLDRRTFR